MKYDELFTFDELPKLQPDSFRSWPARARYRKDWHKRVAGHVLILKAKPKTPLETAVVSCTRHSTREPDRDNLVQSFKPILDGFVKAGVLKDDSPAVIGAPEYSWEKTGRGKGRITVWIREP